MAAIEVKSGSTVTGDFFKPLNKVAELVPDVVSKTVVYGGTARQDRSDCTVVPLTGLGSVIDRLDIDQELSDFISERTSAVPSRTDVAAGRGAAGACHGSASATADGSTSTGKRAGISLRIAQEVARKLDRMVEWRARAALRIRFGGAVRGRRGGARSASGSRSRLLGLTSPGSSIVVSAIC